LKDADEIAGDETLADQQITQSFAGTECVEVGNPKRRDGSDRLGELG
jgi:hypothetical protein